MLRRALIFALALTVVPSAAAATFSFSLGTSSPVTAPGVTLNGDDQSKTFTVASTVAYTGSGNTSGWHVSASSTTLTLGSATLPAMQVNGVTSSCAGSCTNNPNTTVTWPVTLSSSSQEIFNARTFSGRGTFDLTATFEVDYPANAKPGRYTATLTLTGATGP